MMRGINIYIVLVALLFSCTPEELPPDIISVESPFVTTIEIDGFSSDFDPEHYAVITGWGADRVHEDYLSFWGQYVPADCAQDCGPQLSFEFYDVEDRNSSSVEPLEILNVGAKEFALPQENLFTGFSLVWGDVEGVEPEMFCADFYTPDEPEFIVVCYDEPYYFDGTEAALNSFNLAYEDNLAVLGFSPIPDLPLHLFSALTVSMREIEANTVEIELLNVDPFFDVGFSINENEPIDGSKVILVLEDSNQIVIQIRSRENDMHVFGIVIFIESSSFSGDRSFDIPYLEPEISEFDFTKISDKVRLVLSEDNEEYATGIFDSAGDDFFEIVSIEPYLDNENGDPTYLIHADIQATLRRAVFPLEEITVEAENVPFAVAFPK